jgi:hypothetical protein
MIDERMLDDAKAREIKLAAKAALDAIELLLADPLAPGLAQKLNDALILLRRTVGEKS